MRNFSSFTEVPHMLLLLVLVVVGVCRFFILLFVNDVFLPFSGTYLLCFLSFIGVLLAFIHVPVWQQEVPFFRPDSYRFLTEEIWMAIVCSKFHFGGEFFLDRLIFFKEGVIASCPL